NRNTWHPSRARLESERPHQMRAQSGDRAARKAFASTSSGRCRPVGEVGGDFFDFVALDNCSLLVSIGDVSGKGVPAAIIMAGVQASLRALAVSYGPSLRISM